MADIKVTGLSAITPPLDNGSLFLTSSYDGVSAYTSEKLTLTQLRDEVYLMEAEDKLTFDSSGTNKVLASDSNSNAEIQFNSFGGNDVLVSTDNGGQTKGYVYMDDTLSSVGFNLAGTDGGQFAMDTTEGLLARYFTSGGNSYDVFRTDNNTAAPIITNNITDSYGVTVGARNATMNQNVTNAVIAGGVGVTADKDDYLFFQNAELQGGTLNMTAESKIVFDSSGTNKTFVSDSNSGVLFTVNAYGGDDFEITTDSGGFTESWVFGDNGVSGFGAGFGNTQILATSDIIELRVDINDRPFASSSAAYTTPNFTQSPTSISSQNTNIGGGTYINSAAIGGSGLTINKSGYLFTSKQELQLSTETFSFEDSGSVGATEQDWIEVSVGGVTGYVRVYATK